MDVRVTPIHRLLTIHKSAVISIFLHFVHGRYRTARSWDWEWVGMVKWNGPFRSDQSNREKWSTSKGGPLFSKLFRLDRTDPFSFRPKFPEILVEWIAPVMCDISDARLPSSVTTNSYWSKCLGNLTLRRNVFFFFKQTIQNGGAASVTIRHATRLPRRTAWRLRDNRSTIPSPFSVLEFRVHGVHVVYGWWQSFLHNLLIFGAFFFIVKSCIRKLI